MALHKTCIELATISDDVSNTGKNRFHTPDGLVPRDSKPQPPVNRPDLLHLAAVRHLPELLVVDPGEVLHHGVPQGASGSLVSGRVRQAGPLVSQESQPDSLVGKFNDDGRWERGRLTTDDGLGRVGPDSVGLHDGVGELREDVNLLV